MRPAAVQSPSSTTRQIISVRSALLRLAALTPAVLLIHGYHPFADDAAIYVAGIRKLVDPSLFRVDAPFVTANTHLSIFAHVLAAAVRITHLPLSVVLLATYLVSTYLFLLGSWLVASRLFARGAQCWLAVLLASACFTLPAAGTALAIMDPYVTARSFSTPLCLFAVAAVLGRRWWFCALLIGFMALMHPLMAVYGAAFVVLYALIDTGHLRAAIALGMVGIASAGVIALETRHLPVSQAYVEAMHSSARSFLYPSEWKWYEDLGLLAPLLMYLAAARICAEKIRKVCIACLVLGACCTAAAFLFVHPTGPYFLVRLQLLRSFHILYLLGVLLLGGLLGAKVNRWVAISLVAAVAMGLFAAQRAQYPLSAHIEWSGAHPRNPWSQAYLWIRDNTPEDAVFAADPHLIFRDGVDQQGFRATAERSLLADDKDQGVAAVMDPSIAQQWAAQRNAQVGIDLMSDDERAQRLEPIGATWLLLRVSDKTDFPCPYRNKAAKVCRMK